ncbi:MAG: right-handed parallel beta-helix repeat-containing protein, partial [Bacteroidota bacterium]
MTFLLNGCTNGRIYVDLDAGGSNDGTSWTDAFTSVQDALEEACACGSAVDIWVAEGTYYPDEGGTATPDDRNSTFQLCNNVALYGGFAGTESMLSERDLENNTTILSGDLQQNDSQQPIVTDISALTGNDENAFSVLTGSGTDNTALLDGFTITAGNANQGGGMYNDNGSPSVSNCVFSGNNAAVGGGMYNFGASPTISNSEFNGNNSNNGGGMLNTASSAPLITDCVFSSNSAGLGGGITNFGSSATITNTVFNGNNVSVIGGGVLNNSSSSAQIINCVFSGNNADSQGGGMAISSTSSAEIINSVFSGNNAASLGGGIWNRSSNLPITNTIIWNNQENGSTTAPGASIDNDTATPEIANSIVANSGGSDSWNASFGTDSGNNLDVDPDFNTAVDPATAPTTAGDFQLLLGSPAREAGDDAAVPNDITTDLTGMTRFRGDAVDMGPYEAEIPVVVTPGGSQSDDIAGDLSTTQGLSWGTALGTLQDALELACNNPEITQIWVAAGTYYPDEGASQVDNDRNSTFRLCNGVAIYGGFVGGETSLEDRDPENNVTILSGDIDQDDDAFEPEVDSDANTSTPSQTDHINGSNAYHVVTGSGTDNTALLDGFTITGGNANGSVPNERGGGMYNVAGSPSISNTTISGNNASGTGGGMDNSSSSSPNINQSNFIGNTAVGSGGGMFNFSSSPSIVACIFSNNHVIEFGGGICNNVSSSPIISDSQFRMNNANDRGGAIASIASCFPLITNSIFNGNNAGVGGGMYNNNNGSPTIINSVFSGNNASVGGGMDNRSFSFPIIINSVFSGNNSSSSLGGGIYNASSSSPTIVNTIIWNNQASGSTITFNSSIRNTSGATTKISNSIIANSGGSDNWNTDLGQDNGNNKDVDPQFVDPIDPANAPTTTGNYSILPTSPAINMGDNDADLDGTGSGTETISDVPTDLAGNARILEDIVDIGAYEVLSEPPCGPEDSYIDLAAATYYIQPCEETTDFTYSFLINDPCGVPDDFNFFEDVTGNRGGLGINGSSHEVRENSIYVELNLVNAEAGTYNITFSYYDFTTANATITVEAAPEPNTEDLSCNDDVFVTLDENCSAEVTADMVLDGDNICNDLFTVVVDYGMGMKTVDEITECGQFKYEVYLNNGASPDGGDDTGPTPPDMGIAPDVSEDSPEFVCWGYITGEDKDAPVYEETQGPFEANITCTDIDSLAKYSASDIQLKKGTDINGMDSCFFAGKTWDILEDQGVFFVNEIHDNCTQFCHLAFEINDILMDGDVCESELMVLRTIRVTDEKGNTSTFEVRFVAEQIELYFDELEDEDIDLCEHPNAGDDNFLSKAGSPYWYSYCVDAEGNRLREYLDDRFFQGTNTASLCGLAVSFEDTKLPIE